MQGNIKCCAIGSEWLQDDTETPVRAWCAWFRRKPIAEIKSERDDAKRWIL
jgi:hypothetical protein